ncbi:hypothetical protein ATN83_1766 [Raoultella ornithinolytica]|nr:hypothetical protein ATN83_1766 [Raoultella ornithinolytica]
MNIMGGNNNSLHDSASLSAPLRAVGTVKYVAYDIPLLITEGIIFKDDKFLPLLILNKG